MCCCGGFSTSKQEYAVDSLKYFPRVRTSRIMFENFSPDRIKNSLVKETGLTNEVADKIALDIANRINTLDLDFLSGPLIR